MADHLTPLGIVNITVGSILTPRSAHFGTIALADKRGQDIKNYENCLASFIDTVGSLIKEDALDPLRLRYVSNNIMDKLMHNYHIFRDLSSVKSHDLITFSRLSHPIARYYKMGRTCNPKDDLYRLA